ncbi:hypothetical protein D9613_010810 [Agrocybe pediades]|uniref:F-box protein n=1 Tax=Agrocybe pediades TaxID=84607 RepID=A0A8H4VKC8_9AGAR|nr:hypothetical protein D9613_010810 [Agrocybe pediades]
MSLKTEKKFRGIFWKSLHPISKPSNSICPPTIFFPSGYSGDCAPLLRTFSVQGNHYVFDTMAPWLKNLSHVTICGCLAFGEVVGALEEMPSLVTLKICCNETDLDVAGPVVNLPQLKKLTLCFRSDMLNGVALLERIKPASDCCICIPGEPAEWSPAPEEEEYERYEDAISAHVLPYLKTHPPTVVYVVFTYDTLFLQEGSSASPDPEHLYPGFRIPFYVEFFGSSLLMQELIGSASFSNVTELHLSRWGESPYYEDVDVVSALRAFPSVTTLKTTDRVLGLLLENHSITATLFPALVTLNTRDPEGFQPGKEEPAQHRFLKLRKAVGRPVSVLELSFLFGNIPDMDYLEEHTGLLVKWSSRLNGDGEYRCGDGGQEVLRFHSNVWEDEEAGWKLFCAQYSL